MCESIEWAELVKMRQACVPKLTQRAMADRLGISSMYMSDLEHGKRPVSDKWRIKYQAELAAWTTDHPLAAPAPSVEMAADPVPIATETVTTMAETITIAAEEPTAPSDGFMLRHRPLATEVAQVAVDAGSLPENPPAS